MAQEVKGKRRKSSGQQSHVLMKVLPPALRTKQPAQVRSLSVMEEFQVVQAQLQQAEDAFTKQVITFVGRSYPLDRHWSVCLFDSLSTALSPLSDICAVY
jgi:hypothetical protein